MVKNLNGQFQKVFKDYMNFSNEICPRLRMAQVEAEDCPTHLAFAYLVAPLSNNYIKPTTAQFSKQNVFYFVCVILCSGLHLFTC